MTKLLFEIFTVGILTSIIGVFISTLLMLPSKKFSWKKYDFWPQVMLSYF